MALEHLFGSMTRWRLLGLFVQNPEKSFFVRELVRAISGHVHAVRRELHHLEAAGIICAMEEPDKAGNPWGSSLPSDKKKKYYVLSPHCLFYDELSSLFQKDNLSVKQECMKALTLLQGAEYVLVSGVFTGDMHAPIDVLIVGAVAREKIALISKTFEERFGNELRYTHMSIKEYLYRRDIVDRFLNDLIDRKHMILLDRVNSSHEKQIA